MSPNVIYQSQIGRIIIIQLSSHFSTNDLKSIGKISFQTKIHPVIFLYKKICNVEVLCIYFSMDNSQMFEEYR